MSKSYFKAENSVRCFVLTPSIATLFRLEVDTITKKPYRMAKTHHQRSPNQRQDSSNVKFKNWSSSKFKNPRQSFSQRPSQVYEDWGAAIDSLGPGRWGEACLPSLLAVTRADWELPVLGFPACMPRWEVRGWWPRSLHIVHGSLLAMPQFVAPIQHCWVQWCGCICGSSGTPPPMAPRIS